MNGFYRFGAKLTGCLAGIFAVLALLATPSMSQADQYSDCLEACSGFTGNDRSMCMGQCMSNPGFCVRSAWPNCTDRTCYLYGTCKEWVDDNGNTCDC